MREWVALGGLGVGLFTVALVGTLAVQGRLDYEGTRGVPIVSWLFAAPDATEATADESSTNDQASVTDGESTTDTPQQPRALGTQGGQPPRSASEPPLPKVVRPPPIPADLEPGSEGLFSFPQLDSGMSAADLDRILGAARAAEDAARRDRALVEAREAELIARQRDLEDRESSIAAQMLRVDQERERLERRIAEFESKVLLVEQDELRGLREYARTLAAFDPGRAASIVLEEWASDDGRKRITKVLAVMDPADADAVLARIEQSKIRELLLERLKIVHEPRRR